MNELRTGIPAEADIADEITGESLGPHSLLNMELSTLSFNEKVLALAEDPDVPLLERVRFISILGSNLDEFFMTRVAGYKRQVATGSTKQTLDGMTPQAQLELIAARAHSLVERAYRHLNEVLFPRLEEQGVRVLSWAELDDAARDYLEQAYLPNIDAILTPVAIDPERRFPHIRNLRPALAVVLRDPESSTKEVVAVPLPGDLPRFVPLPGGRRFVPLEEVIRAGLPRLYPDREIGAVCLFRVSRSANFSVDEDEMGDLLEAVEQGVARRPFQAPVRLEVQRGIPDELRKMLRDGLCREAQEQSSTLTEDDVYTADGPLDLQALGEIASLPFPEYRYPSLRRSAPLDRHRPVFETLREEDVLVQFPDDSFEATIERALAEAVGDPAVRSVKITLYRTNRSSRIVKLLRRARRKGKQVVAVVELRASFDERRNIEWARSLEAAGIRVVYGPPQLKVHAKIALIVRREAKGSRRYFYIGTGNLNAATAATYTDLGLLSTDPRLGAELAQVFKFLTKGSEPRPFEHLLVAPFNMRERFLEMIEREAEHALAGRGGSIRAKLNGLADRGVIAALYRASEAGVRIDLSVRGICSLRAGVPELSENIRVISILGRFLEHPRIFRFDNAGEPEYYIGSADWRPRNLVRRVEVVTPIENPQHRAQLDRILDRDFTSPERWELLPDGTYTQQGGRTAEAAKSPFASA